MNYLDVLLVIVLLVFLVVLYLKVLRGYLSLSDIRKSISSAFGGGKGKYTQMKKDLQSELETLKKDKKESEDIIKEAKKRYMTHKIDEATYKEIVKENESRIIQIDLKLKRFTGYI